MANQHIRILADHSTTDLHSTSGEQWLLLTDSVMGGVSDGQLSLDTVQNRPCLRMTGDVKLENNGGFIQTALNLSEDSLHNITAYSGLMLEVYGNNNEYNIHLRTRDILLPWQSYRVTFTASSTWKTLYIPFAEFEPYRIKKALNIKKLKRVGLVAIGREFSADICIGKIGLYK